jgi:hypothetical protein
MFIVAQKGLRLNRGFYVWSFLMMLGAVGLTMHIHYDPALFEPLPKSKARPKDEAWYVSVGDKNVGPATFDDLALMAKRGLLTPEMQVWCSADNRWRQAGTVPNLFAKAKPWWLITLLIVVAVLLILIVGF